MLQYILPICCSISYQYFAVYLTNMLQYILPICCSISYQYVAVYLTNMLQYILPICCSISYQFSNDVESKMAKFLQLIGTIKGTTFRKVRKETILKICNNLIVPTFLYGSENWTVTASQRRRIEAAEMK